MWNSSEWSAAQARKLCSSKKLKANVLHFNLTYLLALMWQEDRHEQLFPCFQSVCSTKLTGIWFQLHVYSVDINLVSTRKQRSILFIQGPKLYPNLRSAPQHCQEPSPDLFDFSILTKWQTIYVRVVQRCSLVEFQWLAQGHFSRMDACWRVLKQVSLRWGKDFLTSCLFSALIFLNIFIGLTLKWLLHYNWMKRMCIIKVGHRF